MSISASEICSKSKLKIEAIFENKEDFSIKAKNFAMNNDWDYVTRQIIEVYQEVFDDYNVRCD